MATRNPRTGSPSDAAATRGVRDASTKPGKRGAATTGERDAATPGARRDASSVTDAELARRATEALKNAYSPYSNIRVGAALLAADGRVFTGCNVENASFGMTLCAERAAVVKAVSEGAREFTALALATDHEKPLMPCGACRQVLFEFAPRLRVLVTRPDGTRLETILESLLPDAFGPLDMR
jgi:cytidine deaminase